MNILRHRVIDTPLGVIYLPPPDQMPEWTIKSLETMPTTEIKCHKCKKVIKKGAIWSRLLSQKHGELDFHPKCWTKVQDKYKVS